MGEVDYFHGIGPWYKQYEWNIKKEVGASSLLSAGCHALDALRWFMGGEVEEVMQYATAGGGALGPLSAEQSVQGMRGVVGRLVNDETGV